MAAQGYVRGRLLTCYLDNTTLNQAIEVCLRETFPIARKVTDIEAQFPKPSPNPLLLVGCAGRLGGKQLPYLGNLVPGERGLAFHTTFTFHLATTGDILRCIQEKQVIPAAARALSSAFKRAARSTTV